MLKFDGLVAVVTGAGRGLGREHALLLAARGCRVVVNDLGVAQPGSTATPAEMVAAEIGEARGIAIADHHDVVDGAQHIIDTAIAQFGRIDIVINNAGTIEAGPFGEMDAQIWQRVADVHYRGTVAVCRAAWPHLIRSGRGRIINTSSSGMLGGAHLTSYSSAKAAIFGFTRSLALEGTEYGINVNAIMPSASTRMTERIDDPAVQEVLRSRLQARRISPLVAWLAHPETTLTGQILRTSGGMASRLITATTASITVGEDTPEAWASEAHRLMADQPFIELRSTLDSFARELAEADPDIDLSKLMGSGNIVVNPEAT